MPNTPQRTRKRRNNLSSLNLCFPNRMQPFTPESPTTTSSSFNHNRQSSPATSSNSFNDDDDPTVNIQNPFPNLQPEPEPADLVTAFASQRFFFSSPGRSNSIFESTNTDADCTTSSSSLSTTTAPPPHEPPTIHQNRLKGIISDRGTEDSTVKEKETAVFSGGVAVEKYSTDPYGEFRLSMEEMVEARPELMEVNSNWHLLHELLLCYLALNPKNMHKFIFAAFADLLVNLISVSSSSSPPPPQKNAGAGEVTRGRDGCSD